MSDPIADMLTRIRNANTAKHDTVDVPSSKMKIAIADILVKEGYVAKYDKVDKVRGMDIIFVTTAKTDEEARELLTLFNMPFAK